jgi:predicted nuclease of predicted toxin-antitoxin system
LRLLLDEMYGATLAEALRAARVDAVTVAELGLRGRSDHDVFAAAIAERCVLLTENVADFARIAADHVTAGQHHHGVLIMLSTRFSRRPAGRGAIVAAVLAAAGEPLQDRVLYLER